jgi:CBS domain-containing protein/sporulation protein YlmC with PRC-barrel domain
MAETLFYFTELLGLPVHDLRKRRIGRVKDAAVVPLINAVRVDRFLVGAGGAWLSIRYDQVRTISFKGLFLSDEKLTPYHSDEYMLRIDRDLLDQQIIDVNGRKVVRVNDVTFNLEHDGERDVLNVLEVDIGVRSIIRRVLQGAVPPQLVRRVQWRIAPHSIPWEFCNIVEPDPLRRLRLNISNDRLERLHPADLADIVEELGSEERESIFETIDSESAAELLSEVDPRMQASILESLEPEVAADIIEEMSPDEAADVLSELEDETSEEILDEMEDAPGEEVRELLEYKENTAGGMMNTEFLSLPDSATIADAMAALRRHEDLLETLNVIFLVDLNDRLTGAVPLARLFLAGGETALVDIVSETLISAPVTMNEDRVTELFDKYNLFTLPVIEEDGRLAGVVTADDIISVLREK